MARQARELVASCLGGLCCGLVSLLGHPPTLGTARRRILRRPLLAAYQTRDTGSSRASYGEAAISGIPSVWSGRVPALAKRTAVRRGFGRDRLGRYTLYHVRREDGDETMAS